MKSHLLFLFVCVLGLLSAKEQSSLESSFEQLMGKQTAHWSYVQLPQDRETLEFARILYEKNKGAQFAYEGEFKIPRVVHFIWLGPKPFPAQSVENIRTWLAHNPDWKVKFWTDRPREAPCSGMEVVMVQDFSFRHLARCYEESENWGEKSDVLRYEILLQEGGVYADHDANCLRSFDGMHRGYDFYCCLETPHEAFVGLNITCGNGVLGSRAEHPTVAKVVDLIASRWNEIGEKYRGKDEYSRVEVVMQRTYIALTHALKGTIDQEGNTDIILPSAYFFSKTGIPSLYSKHFYATAWDDSRVQKSELDKIGEKTLSKIEKKSETLQKALTVFLVLNAGFLAFCLYRLSRTKKLLKPHSN